MNLEAKIIKPKLGLLELSRRLGSGHKRVKSLAIPKTVLPFQKALWGRWRTGASRYCPLEQTEPKESSRSGNRIPSRKNCAGQSCSGPAKVFQRIAQGRIVYFSGRCPVGLAASWSWNLSKALESLGRQGCSGRDHSNGVSAPSHGKSERRKAGHWRGLKQNIPVIWLLRIPSRSAIWKALDGSASRLWLTPIPKRHLPNYMTGKRTPCSRYAQWSRYSLLWQQRDSSFACFDRSRIGMQNDLDE